MAFSAAGTLYFMPAGASGQLHTVNVSTGNTTVVAQLSGAPIPSKPMKAAAFDPFGTLYAVNGGGDRQDPPLTRLTRLVTVNTTTGVVTDVGAGVNELDAIEFGCSPFPTPTPTTTATATPTQTPGPSATAGTPTTTPEAQTATATGTPGPGGGGEEPQDVLICESQPGGPRELRIKASEWPRYQDHAARGPCPASGAPAIVQALPPAFVADTAGTLTAAGAPAAVTPSPTLRLERAGRVRITLLGARSNFCDGDILLLAPALSPTPLPGTADGTLPPGARRLWSSYLRHAGESVELGPYPAGTTLVLGLAPWRICAAVGEGPRPSNGAYARVTAGATAGTWDVWWEDFRQEGADFDDLVVRVEVLPSFP
jgi:hypothetical protein